MSTDQAPAHRSPRIIVVGPCASGKTTLVQGLRERGYEAQVSGQEHSDIPSLWRHTEPDVVIALHVDLPNIRARRHDPSWPAWLLARQRHRLRQAVDRADVLIDTSGQDAVTVLTRTMQRLAELDGGDHHGHQT
jgi:hypothetical protein